MDSSWLRVADCPLLHGDWDNAPPALVRWLQRLLEISLAHGGSDAFAERFLDELAHVVRADRTAIVEALPEWHVRWQVVVRGVRLRNDQLPRLLLAEVLDREAGALVPSKDRAPAWLAACVGERERSNRVVLAARMHEPFQHRDLEIIVAAGHFLGLGLERCRLVDQRGAAVERLEALLAISRQFAAQRETVPLLETIAEQATRLLRCERSSIFLWDRNRHELVGRPAQGLPGGELRIPDDRGIVGRCVQSGQVCQVDDVHREAAWNPGVDAASGFQTRSLLCVPLVDPRGERLGAVEVLNKKQGTFTAEDVETLTMLAALAAAALCQVRERELLLRSQAQLEDEVRKGSQIIGESLAIQAVRATVERVARTDLPVLILGESGTGKEVVARAIHYHSPRRRQPFVPVNCAALAETLLESELFGHEKGAFTDAVATRPGKFEQATGGTLFLDEIGDLSPGGQAKLLRVLEEKVVYRVGGSQPIPVDTRVLAATNRNLADAVRAGKFREDLFYRLTVVTLELPPLRQRRADILPLAEYFLEQFARGAGRRSLQLSPEARRRLEQHDWPGNVRELRNLMERVAFLCPEDRIEADDLAFLTRLAPDDDRFADLPLAEATEAFQREHIRRAIARAGQNMSDAARLLGLHRSNLYRKMRQLGMDVPKG
ncbi:MAG: sigma 54-interacting transcriptional regulator [Gemmataceae bacterium]|nr:sigma 54-interacting transcriptional regulator [Gemmataceae bacterium]MDW8266994.1 sigma 54-interacting transcriptional regulator [Gemmataceae bacterium]